MITLQLHFDNKESSSRSLDTNKTYLAANTETTTDRTYTYHGRHEPYFSASYHYHHYLS